MEPPLSGGRLVAVERASPTLAPGPLDAIMELAGVPVTDLATGTRLPAGASVVIELGGPPALGGLREAPDGATVPARVVTGGRVQVGDAVAVEAVTVPVEDAIDLHAFRPDEIAAVVEEYLTRAQAAGFEEV